MDTWRVSPYPDSRGGIGTHIWTLLVVVHLIYPHAFGIVVGIFFRGDRVQGLDHNELLHTPMMAVLCARIPSHVK